MFKITTDTPLECERRTAEIIALYVTGPVDKINDVFAAVRRYARAFFGVSGPVSSGCAINGDSATVQVIFSLRSAPNRPDRFRHGQHAMYYPAWATTDDDLINYGEEVIIEEVIDPDTHVAVRPLNSDAVFTVHPDLLSSPFGAPCQCARVGGDAFPC